MSTKYIHFTPEQKEQARRTLRFQRLQELLSLTFAFLAFFRK